MAHATESKFFLQQRFNSLNSTVNSKEQWVLDIRPLNEMTDVRERIETDLNEGIIKHARAKRMQHLEKHIVTACYTQADFTFEQAQMCEKYHMKNDYKLSMINNFVADHMVKHLKTWNNCSAGAVFDGQKDNVDKDRMFVECHHRWVKNLKEEVAFELDSKARQLLL